MLNIGVIGLGIGMKHAAAIAKHPACNLKYLCDFSDEKLTEGAKMFTQATCISDANILLNDPEIDIVSIASFDDYHYEQTIRALENGKHVFVEKPLCQNRKQAQDIAELLVKTGLHLSSNLVLRACPRFRWLHDHIRSGRMGRVFYMEGDYLWGRMHKLIDGWRGKMDYYSIIQGAAVHIIDLLLWFADELPREVLAVGSDLCSRGSGFNFNDLALLVLRFDSGMVIKISAVSGCVHPHFHRVAVFGDSGTFIQERFGAHLFSDADPASNPEELTLPYPGNQQADIITSFVDVVSGAATRPMICEEDVFNAMSICFAAEEAVKRKCAVSIDYIRP